MDIEKHFNTGITVAPTKRRFYLVVGCDGAAQQFKSRIFAYGKEEPVVNPLDLGEIDLRSHGTVTNK